MPHRRISLPKLLLLALAAVVFAFHVWPQASGSFRWFPQVIAGMNAAFAPDENTPKSVILEQRATIRRLQEENDTLRRDVAIQGDLSLPKVMARVLGKDPDPTRRALWIVLPKVHSVKPGNAVMAPGEAFVGIVEHVEGRMAIVLLLTDPSLRIAAQVMGTDGLITRGESGSLTMTLIPAVETPVSGSTVVTSGTQKHIPRGLLIGTTLPEPMSPGDPFAKLFVVPAAPLETITSVSILTDT